MYCYNCMRKISDENNYCPHCGRESYPDRTPHYLSPGTMLNNRYLIGNAMGEDGFTITYIARDMNIDERVAVREYYPMGHATRGLSSQNQVELVSESEAAYFSKGSDSFVSQARLAKQNGSADIRDIFSGNGTVYVVSALKKQTVPTNAAVTKDYNDSFEGETPDNTEKRDINSAVPARNMPVQKKKKKGGVIAVIVIASVLIAALAGTLIFVFANKGKTTPDKQQTTISTTVAATSPSKEAKHTEAENTDVKMPNVTGLKLSDAQAQLGSLGLRVEISRQEDYEVAKDYIIRQSTSEGQTLKKGDTVMLYVSDGYTEVTEETHPAPVFTLLEASSTYNPGDGKSYAATNIVKNDNSFWAGDGDNASLTFSTNKDQWVKGVKLINGSASDFGKFGRATLLRFEFSDGTSIEKTVSDITSTQTIDFDREVKTNSVKITVIEKVNGSELENVAITYVAPY